MDALLTVDDDVVTLAGAGVDGLLQLHEEAAGAAARIISAALVGADHFN